MIVEASRKYNNINVQSAVTNRGPSFVRDVIGAIWRQADKHLELCLMLKDYVTWHARHLV